MTSSFQRQRAAAQLAKPVQPVRIGVPQIDPGAGASSAPATPTPAEATNSRLEQPKRDDEAAVGKQSATGQTDGSTTTAPVTMEDPRLQPVDTSVKVQPFGTHAYPGRAAQVRHEAFMLDVKPWQVVEIALDEYFRKRYGKPTQNRPK